jgi:hypothetical protein
MLEPGCPATLQEMLLIVLLHRQNRQNILLQETDPEVHLLMNHRGLYIAVLKTTSRHPSVLVYAHIDLRSLLRVSESAEDM